MTEESLRVRIARDLREVRLMFSDLRAEAFARADDPTYIPGGDAMVMLGPGADAEAFGYMQLSAIFGRIGPDAVEEPLPDDIEPPLSFLASWSDRVRTARDQPTFLRATIDREIDYLLGSLDYMTSTDDAGEPRFIDVEEFADGLRKVRRAMEDVLKAGDRAEFTRVYCIAEDCGQPRLMKLWGAQARWDRYRCPSCRTEYDAKQFMMARTQNLHSAGADKFVLVRDAIAASGVPKATVHSWIRRDMVESERDEKTGRLMVWWPDIRDRANERRMQAKVIS